MARQFDPASLELTFRLARLEICVDTFKFTTAPDYLMGMAWCYEPHSFESSWKQCLKGKTYSWRYDSFEGRTVQIPDECGDWAGSLMVEAAGPPSSRIVPDALRPKSRLPFGKVLGQGDLIRNRPVQSA